MLWRSKGRSAVNARETADVSWGRCQRLLIGALGGLALLGTAIAEPGPYSHEAIASKDYQGITLNVLALDTPVLGEPVVLHAREFEELTGAKVNVNRVSFPELYQEALLGLRQQKFDALFFGSMWIADVVEYLAPIPPSMLESAQYREVLPHYKHVASWGDTAYMVPVDGDRHYLQYRRDLLEDPAFKAAFKRQTGRELGVPKTWPELQEIARFFHGRKTADGQTMCFFDAIKAFGRGNVVFSDSWDDPFVEAMEPGNRLHDRVAASLSPGSRKVWNRETGRWDSFPEVNYAPYIVYGWTSGVAAATPHQQAAFDFLGFHANPSNHRADLQVGRFGMNPFRQSDLDERFWVERAGWDPLVARSYVQRLEKQSQSRNRVLDLRIHRGQEYVYILSIGVYRTLTGRDTPQAALDEVARRWKRLTERVGVDRQREAYRHVVRFEDGG